MIFPKSVELYLNFRKVMYLLTTSPLSLSSELLNEGVIGSFESSLFVSFES